jgi:predicted RNase H-like HicB family nuclease
MTEKGIIHKGGGVAYSFGESKAAINLMSNILEMPEYKGIRHNVLSNLARQDTHLNAIMDIKDKNTRQACLEMWHMRFVGITEGYPEVVRSHVRNVETAIYRKLLKRSNANMNEYKGYKTIIERDGKEYHGYSPALKGLHTCGATIKETMLNMKDAIDAYLQSCMTHGDPIPVKDGK